MDSSKPSLENIYKLDGTVPFFKALPFGLQHILAMFVANLAPIIIITSSANPALTPKELTKLIQNAMFVFWFGNFNSTIPSMEDRS